MFHRTNRRSKRRGFSLVEALVALTLMTIIGGALLARFGDQGRYVADSLDQTVAEGLAQQLMNEIAGCRFVDPDYENGGDGYRIPEDAFGPDAGDVGVHREKWDDIDDYHGYGVSNAISPPLDRYGVPIGKEDVDGSARHPRHMTPPLALAGWRQEVRVYYGYFGDDDKWQREPTGYVNKEVEIKVRYMDPLEGLVDLAVISRIFARVPPP